MTMPMPNGWLPSFGGLRAVRTNVPQLQDCGHIGLRTMSHSFGKLASSMT